MTVFLDAFAVVALLRDEPAADQVEALLRRGDAAVTAVNLAEVLDVMRRAYGVDEHLLDAVVGPLVADSLAVVPVDERLARRAAQQRARHYHRTRSPLSLADCVLLGAAQGAELATADGPVARAARAEATTVIALPDARGRRP